MRADIYLYLIRRDQDGTGTIWGWVRFGGGGGGGDGTAKIMSFCVTCAEFQIDWVNKSVRHVVGCRVAPDNATNRIAIRRE